ncbi:MAG: glycoside hydrolase family 3 protein [Alkalispirochaeta sp.]
MGIRKLVFFGAVLVPVLLALGSCATDDATRRTQPTPEERVEGGEADGGVPEERREGTREQRGETPGTEETDVPTERSGRQDSPERLPEERPEVTVDATIDAIIASMTRRQLIGQLLMPAFIYDRRGQPVTSMGPELQSFIEDVEPGGVLLFAENIRSPEQVRTLVAEMQRVAGIPLLVAVDQEGGVVRRLVPTEAMPATAIPAAGRVGRSGDADLAYELAGVIARELRSLGITVNLAPVADVATNPENTVIGSRAYGSDPEEVARIVAATVEGLQTNGVSAALKHFPGHGDTMEDSHVAMAVFPHGIDRLRMVELVPFSRGIAAGSDAVMTGHISVPELTGADEPATLSRAITTDLLRDDLGFDGVVITDALTMAGLTRYFSAEEIPVRALEAGADLLLRPVDARFAADVIARAVADGALPMERVEASVRRILHLKIRRGLIVPPGEIESTDKTDRRDPGDEPFGDVAAVSPPDDPERVIYYRPVTFFPEVPVLGIPEHQAIVDEIMRRSSR